MNPLPTMKTLLLPVLATLASIGCLNPALSGRASSFAEPPIVVYGKVIQVGPLGGQQLNQGELRLTLVNSKSPAHVVTRSTSLGWEGADGAFSYRMELPVKFQPMAHELGDALSVAADDTPFRIQSLTINGVPAAVIDPSLHGVTTRFADRAGLLRMDVRVAMDSSDTDSDGMPDWWEDLHGLNRHSAADATGDRDGDGLSNGEEFRLGTDPEGSNRTPRVQSAVVEVPSGGQAGLHLTIVDSDTDLTSAPLAYTKALPGISWRRSGKPLGPGEDFPYGEMLQGKIILTADPGARSGVQPMRLMVDGSSTNILTFDLQVVTFSPLDLAPALWLTADSVISSGPVEEWLDSSGNHRDAFNGVLANQPSGLPGQGIVFGQGRYQYVDDKNLDLKEATTFLTFDPSRVGSADQALLGSAGLQIRIGGETNGSHARVLYASAHGRQVSGPVIPEGELALVTVGSDSQGLFISMADWMEPRAIESPPDDLSSFTTLGGLRGFSDAQASDFFSGKMREVLLFDTLLTAAERLRVEDYRASRWEGRVVWDKYQEAVPQAVQGAADARNILVGGWAGDDLSGGDLDDVLRGGPGSDRLTGGGGPDRFEILPESGADIITDFSVAEGDRLDLRGVFAGKAGSPGKYLHFQVQAQRNLGDSGTQLVTSYLQVDYEGDGGVPDQVIALNGVSLGDADLPRLVGEGTLLLGGPSFDLSIRLATPNRGIIETDVAYPISVIREGNTQAAIQVALSFTGTATPDQDYRIYGAAGTGVVRVVSLAAGQTSAVFTLTPTEDAEFESETIAIQVMPAPALTSIPDAPLILTMDEAAYLAIRTTRHLAATPGSIGLIEIRRSGRMDIPLTVPLDFGGTLLNGIDYEALPQQLALPPGVGSQTLEIRLKTSRASINTADEIQVGLVANETQYALANPRRTSVLVFPYGSLKPSFSQWLAEQPGGTGDLFDYLTGGDASPDAGRLGIGNDGGFVVLRFSTASELTDVDLSIFASEDLTSWKDVSDEFSLSHEWLPDERIEHRFRSRYPMQSHRTFQVRARQATP